MQQPQAPPGPWTEHRRAPRHQVLRRCFVRPPGAGGGEGWRCIVYDISLLGIGVTLPLPVRPGARLTVIPHAAPGAPELRARVVHARPLAHVWMCGCELDAPMGEDELRAWLAGLPA